MSAIYTVNESQACPVRAARRVARVVFRVSRVCQVSVAYLACPAYQAVYRPSAEPKLET